MKYMRKSAAVILAIVITMQSVVTAYAETAEPLTVQTEDGVSFTQNADGTVTATVYPTMGIEALSAEPVADFLEDYGDSYTNTAENVNIRLGKTYRDGEMLVSIESNGTGITFYPETTAGRESEPEEAVGDPSLSEPEQELVLPDPPAASDETESEAPGELPDAEEPIPQEVPEEPQERPDAEADPAGAEEAAEIEAPAVQAVALAYTDSPEGHAGAEETEGAQQSEEPPFSMETPAPTEKPVVKETPEPTEMPVPTEEPSPTEAPETTEPSAPTEEPLPTETPAPTASPQATPDKTEKPKQVQIYSSVDGVGCGSMGGGYASVIYPGAINEFTDIEIAPLENGMKENIIMHRYTTPQLSYILNFQGLTPALSGNSVLLYDASGSVAATVSAPYLYDAAGNYNHDIGAAIDSVGSGNYRLTYYMDEVWLENAAYPVTLDPTVNYEFDYDNYKFIENSFIASSFPDQNASTFAFSEQALTVGYFQSGEARAYMRMAFPDSVINDMGNGVIQKLELHLYVCFGSGTFTMHQVTGGAWNASSITWNNAPVFDPAPVARGSVSGEGWTTWDLTAAASNWFNALNQNPNYGICMKMESGSVALASSLHDRDEYGLPAYYTITYYKDPSDAGLKLTANGNGANSGTGYVDLSWNAVEGADNYYVGVFNGKAYEYFYVGNQTSWSTKGRGIWPTETEISKGRYTLHGDGSGGELPMIPALAYANAGGGHANDLNYYFTVIPANKYGQAPNPSNYAAQSVRLPDTLAPSVPENVTVSPAAYTNKDEITVTWSGIEDYNDSTSATSSMGSGGSIQYALDNSSAWENTGSTEGNGSFNIDISALADGQHYVYIRGRDSAGNTGTGKYAYFYIDRTAPTAPVLSVTPSDRTNLDSASITWSGIADANALDRVEYSIDGSPYISTGRTEAAYPGYVLDLSSLADGEHSLRLRGVDAAGNEGAAASVSIKRDTTPPTVTDAGIAPESWTSGDSVLIHWTGLEDAHSGMKLIWYSLDGGEKRTISAAEEHTEVLDISVLADGEHRVLLHFEDKVGNYKEEAVNLYRDVTAPEIAMLSPTDGTAVNGVVDITGSVADISLDSWRVIAAGEDGTEHVLQSGATEKSAEHLAVLDCADFGDGEKITLRIEAQDKAGNTNTLTGTVITVDKSAKPVTGTVKIAAPENNAVISAATVTGSYTIDDASAYESRGMLYVDGVYTADTYNKGFLFNALSYPESSGHSLSVISIASDGTAMFSEGLSASVLASGTVESGNGGMVSRAISPAYPVLALKLSVNASDPDGSNIYYYSLDNGSTWNPITPDSYVPMLSRPDSILLKAETGSGVLYGWTLEGLIETSPLRVVVKNLQGTESIDLPPTAVTKALTELAAAPQGAETLCQYEDGILVSDSFTYDARRVDQGESHAVVLLAADADGTLYGTGAAPSILLRESPEKAGMIESGALQAGGRIYALRLEALVTGSGLYSYSTDNTNWTAIVPGEYALLEEAADTVYVRADIGSGKLLAWHVEAVTCTESSVTTELVQPPVNVTAADWSAYYANRALWRYDLSWEDPTPADDTADNTTSYEIYRNGQLVATVTDTQYTDTEYLANAKYEVCTVRNYGEGYTPKVSEKAIAGLTVMQPPANDPIGVNNTPEEEKQGEYLDKLYGGNYIFGAEENAPTDERGLKNELLGSNKYCGYGFEPINFNTGNFLLETVDASWADLGQALLSLERSYNTQSEAADGPFGAKWESAWSEHLRLYDSGEIVYAAPDGANIVFTPRPDGSYSGGEAYALTLTANRNEYHVTDAQGVLHAFTGVGLLKYLQWPDGSRITLSRDEDGLLTGFTLPSGKKIDIESDRDGHITSIATLGGSALTYEYEGKNLVRFTDANGSVTRYVYDAQGRMTGWYDAAGIRQVRNTYDDEDRVIAQTDANGGEYSLEYFDGHTVSTDAQGSTSETWFDAGKRTVKTVDAMGGVTEYAYDAASHITAKTDAAGNTTTYEYDAAGNKTRETAPDGTSYAFTYDENRNVTTMTDQLGHVTRYEYDKNNRLISETAPDGGVTGYTYNEAGQVLSITDPLGNTTRYAYTGALLTESTDANGSVTRYSYDSENRLASTTDALGNTTRFTYDPVGNLLEVRFADDSSFAYEYDAVGSVTSQTDALGNVTRYEYNAMRQLTRTVYPDGSESSNSYDASGNVVSSLDASGGTSSYAYDALGKLTAHTDALGSTTRYEYDPAGRLTKTIYPNGGEAEYTYDKAGQLTSETAPTGETTRYGYDAAGRTVTVTAPDGGVTKNSYDANGRLISETDANGNTVTYAYDLAGRIVSATDALDNTTSFAYDPCGNLISVTDAQENVTRYAYDALGRCVSVTDANGAVTSYAYDAVGSLVSETDALGSVTEYEYDLNGSITALVDALGGRTAMDYDALGYVTSVLQKNGGRVGAEYDAMGKLLKETDALGGVTAYEYNANGLVTKITDTLEQSAEMRYDEMGNVTEITAPDGSAASYAYDLSGRLISETDAAGTKTEYTYDAAGRLSKTAVNGSVTKYAYDPAGNLISVTDAEGRSVTLSYDARNNLTAILYPDGTQDSYEYDALGRLTRYIPRKGEATAYTYNPMGDVLSVTIGNQTTGYEYDPLGRVTAVVNPDGSRTEAEYDALGNLTTATDALGNATQYTYTVDSLLEAVTYANGAKVTAEYDLNGRIVSETGPEGERAAYAYDPVGRLTAATDALGSTTRYAYDAADRLTAITDALGNETVYTYDQNGNLTRETDALGNTTQYTYTPEGWLESITDAEGKVSRFTYDRTGSLLTEDYSGELHRENTYNQIGQLTTVTTAEGVTEYQYDDGGRLLSVTQPNGDTVSYTYDGYGNRLTMSYPNGRTVKYAYDAMNRLISVKGVDGATTKYSYDAMGRRTKTDGAKEDTTYAYDEMGNLISQTSTGAYDLALEYAYDLSGRMTKESRTENGATLISGYEYDKLGQLTAFERSDGITESYTYDPVGNMLTKTQNGVKTQYSYNAANQLVSDGENRYTYDKNGNLVQKGNTKYTYNALNLLQSWTDGQTTETYSYNANGLLSSVTNAEGSISLTWDILMGDGVVIAAQNGESTTTYTYGLERISAQTGNRKTEYIYDGRGSVAAEVSYNNSWYTLGGVLSKKDVVSKSYTPFGEQIGEATSGFGYNGEYYNAVTGQIYLRARFYEPEMNRFSQKDILRGSITSPGSLNRYSYVQNDPVNFIDPSGQSLRSAWNLVKSSVTNTVKNIVSNPVQAVKSAAKAVVNAVTHPVKTVTNAAKSVGNAVRTVYNEVRTPDSQSKYASPATNRGTGSARSGGYSGGSYSGSSGGGAYTAPVYSPYTSNGSATSYFNSNYQTGKTPSPGAPRIEDVTGEAIKYCASGPKKTSSNFMLQLLNSPTIHTPMTYEGYEFNHALEEFNVSEENNKIILWLKNTLGLRRNGTLYETNCYAFALDLTSNPLTNEDFNSKRNSKEYALQPGMLSGNYLYDFYFNIDQKNGYKVMIDMMKDDVEVLGKTMEEYKPLIHKNTEGYVIAVAARHNDANGDYGNYHLFRLNGNQEWESKDGTTEATIVGNNEDSISDIAAQMGYPDFLGLYYIQ